MCYLKSGERNNWSKLYHQKNLLLSLPQDRHCLLELGLQSVEGLIRQGIYPIVIHILPKSKKHKKLRYVHVIFLARCIASEVSGS